MRGVLNAAVHAECIECGRAGFVCETVLLAYRKKGSAKLHLGLYRVHPTVVVQCQWWCTLVVVLCSSESVVL